MLQKLTGTIKYIVMCIDSTKRMFFTNYYKEEFFFFIGIVIITLFSCKTSVEKKSPTDPQATPETVALYNRLFDLVEKGIMLGHQDGSLYGHGWYGDEERSDVKNMVGDYPAMFGFELGHIELGAEYSLDSVYFSRIKEHVIKHHARGGIASFSWHADNIVTGNSTWDCAQDTVVRSVLPGGNLHEEYLVWLGRLADFFLDLKDETGTYIPVIFRMYHEQNRTYNCILCTIHIFISRIALQIMFLTLDIG